MGSSSNGTHPIRIDYDAILAESSETVVILGKDYKVKPITARAQRIIAGVAKPGVDSTDPEVVEPFCRAAALLLIPSIPLDDLLDMPFNVSTDVIRRSGTAVAAFQKLLDQRAAEELEKNADAPSLVN